MKLRGPHTSSIFILAMPVPRLCFCLDILVSTVVHSWVLDLPWTQVHFLRNYYPAHPFSCLAHQGLNFELLCLTFSLFLKSSLTTWTTTTWITNLELSGWEDALEKGKATHSSILTWKIPWTVHGWGHKGLDTTVWLSLSKFLLSGAIKILTGLFAFDKLDLLE